MLLYVTLNIFHQQAIGDQHSDAGLPTREFQTQQLRFPIQEQHSHLQPVLCGGTSGISHHVEEEGAASGYRQLPFQPEDDNQASGWSRSFGGIRQDGVQTTSPQAGQVRNRPNAPVEDERQVANHGRTNGLQNGETPIKQAELVTEHCCDTKELQQLWTENLRRRVVNL